MRIPFTLVFTGVGLLGGLAGGLALDVIQSNRQEARHDSPLLTPLPLDRVPELRDTCNRLLALPHRERERRLKAVFATVARFLNLYVAVCRTEQPVVRFGDDKTAGRLRANCLYAMNLYAGSSPIPIRESEVAPLLQEFDSYLSAYVEEIKKAIRARAEREQRERAAATQA